MAHTRIGRVVSEVSTSVVPCSQSGQGEVATNSETDRSTRSEAGTNHVFLGAYLHQLNSDLIRVVGVAFS